jgi:hypothetical protein
LALEVVVLGSPLAGVDIRTVAEFLGHSDPGSRYGRTHT